MNWWIVLGVIVVLGIVAGIAHLLLTWANRRGLVWYRNDDRPPPRSLGLIEELYQPSVEHVIEAENTEATEADHVESGGPRDPTKPRPDTE